MKNLNVPKNDKERSVFQNFLKRSQKINVNDQIEVGTKNLSFFIKLI